MALTKEQIAQRIAKELKDGYYVNLGIGIPTLVANYIPQGINVVLQSENGLLGMGPFPFEGEEVDEYTDYVPYGRITGSKDYYAVVYWKAGVMQYEFILATYDKDGNPLSHAIIGGLRSDEDGILHSVAVVHEDLSITIAEGVAGDEETNLANTNAYQMSIQPSGHIRYGTYEEETEK